MSARFQGKAAIVTGASRGIGLAVAERLVSEGSRVCITARDPEPLEEAAGSLGENAFGVAGNVSDARHRADTIARTRERFGSLDLLVCNTGINPAYGPLIDTDLGAFEKLMQTNVVATFAWIQDVWRASMARCGGAVVITGALAAVRHVPGIGAYAASKAALMRLSQELAVELGPTVRVNCVAPGVVRTKFASVLYDSDEERAASACPLGRLGEPQDVAAAVAFLLSTDAGWITGETLLIDGGLAAASGPTNPERGNRA